MSSATFAANAWVVAFRQLPPPDVTEAGLIPPHMSGPILAACSTAWGSVRNIVITDTSPSVHMLQAILSELKPDVNAIIFVRPPKELEIALVEWKHASDVRRVVCDTEAPLVSGTVRAVSHFALEKARSYLESPSLPRGFLAKNARLQAEQWREVHPDSLLPPPLLASFPPASVPLATLPAPELPVAFRTPTAKLPAPPTSAAPRLQATYKPPQVAQTRPSTSATPRLQATYKPSQVAPTRTLQVAPTSTGPRLHYAPRAASQTPMTVPLVVPQQIVFRAPAPQLQLRPSNPGQRQIRPASGAIKAQHFVDSAPHVRRKADPGWKRYEAPRSDASASTTPATSSSSRRRAPLDRRPPARRDSPPKRKMDDRGPFYHVLPPNDLRRSLRGEPTKVDHTRDSKNFPSDPSPVYTHTIRNERGDIVPMTGEPVEFIGDEETAQTKRSRRQEVKRLRNKARRVGRREQARQERIAAANAAGVQYDAGGRRISANAPARDALPGNLASASAPLTKDAETESCEEIELVDSDGYETVDSEAENRLLESEHETPMEITNVDRPLRPEAAAFTPAQRDGGNTAAGIPQVVDVSPPDVLVTSIHRNEAREFWAQTAYDLDQARIAQQNTQPPIPPLRASVVPVGALVDVSPGIPVGTLVDVSPAAPPKPEAPASSASIVASPSPQGDETWEDFYSKRE